VEITDFVYGALPRSDQGRHKFLKYKSLFVIAYSYSWNRDVHNWICLL